MNTLAVFLCIEYIGGVLYIKMHSLCLDTFGYICEVWIHLGTFGYMWVYVDTYTYRDGHVFRHIHFETDIYIYERMFDNI